MAGEHILELLLEENTRISLGDRWLVCHGDIIKLYTVYQRKLYQRRTRTLIESTEDEEIACRYLK